VVQQDGAMERFPTGKVNPLRLEQGDGSAVVKKTISNIFFTLSLLGCWAVALWLGGKTALAQGGKTRCAHRGKGDAAE